jgi:hypothetical protein
MSQARRIRLSVIRLVLLLLLSGKAPSQVRTKA